MTFNLNFTHLGLFVRDAETLALFYRRTLGFVETDRGKLGQSDLIFLSRDATEHHQLVFVSGLSQQPIEEVINQISFRMMGGLPDLLAFANSLLADPPDDFRPINHGNAWSLYFRDPEGNRIEVYTPTPWYINQPCRVPLDIAYSAEQIWAATEEWCRNQPGFKPAELFHQKVAALIRQQLTSG